MNLDQLQTKLLKVARKNPPSDRVPYAFEKRIMANLTKPVVDVWALWGKALWRAAAVCTITVAVFGSFSYQTTPTESTDLSQAFEDTVYAALDEQSLPDAEEESW